MRKSRRAIAFLVGFLQAWVPLAFEWQGALAATDAVVQNAGDGQTLGGSVLRGQFGTIRNTTITNQHVDANTASNFNSSGGQLNLQEFGLGGDINAARQKLKDAYDKPDTLNDAAKQARRDIQERGCPSTAFEFVRSATVLTVRPIKITLTQGANGAVTRSESVDTTYTGEVKVSYPTVGYMRTFDQVITVPQVGTPGVSLRYTATPFTVPNDGSFFTFNHRISGSSGTPVVTDFGKKDNGYATTSLVYSSPGGTVTVTVDLYRVKRTYSSTPITGCPADPPSCIVSGLNFCGPPGLGVLDVFQANKGHKNAAMGTLMDAVSAIEYSDTDANMTPIISRGVQALNGSDPVFTEIFTGCSETASFTTNTVTVHQEDIQTCSMPLVDLPLTCNGTRGTRFVYLQESTVLTATFYQRVKVPIINPQTGQQAKDAQGNLLYTEQDKPAIYSGAVDINVPTFGGSQSWSSAPDGSGYFIKYDLTPFSVSANEYFPYDITVQSDGGVSASVSSLGGKGDNWKLAGSASVSGAAQMRLNAKLYQVMNNNLVGCEEYLKHAADGFCTAQMQCTDNRGPCTTLDGVSFCEGSGVAAGVAELLRPWGVEDSAKAGGNLGSGIVGGGAKEFLPRMCWAGIGKKMDCSTGYSGPLNCYKDANGVEQCGNADMSGLAVNFNEGPTHKDDCAAPGINLFGNPNCRLITTNTCSEGAYGLFSGTCYNNTVVYDCGTDRQVVVPGGVSYAQQCNSPIRCMGTECHNPKGEVNHDFGRAVASSNIADMAAKDMVCAETGGPPSSVADICTPLIFHGKHSTCKIPVGNGIGITPNCCQESQAAAADAPDAIKYVQLVMYSYKMASDRMMMSALANVPGLDGFASSMYSSAGTVQSAIDGAIATTKNMMVDAAGTVAKQFGYEIAQPVAKEAAKEYVLDTANMGLTQAQMATYHDFLVNIGMEDLAKELFVETTTEGATSYALSEAGRTVMAVAEMVSVVLMVYAIAKILGHLIFKCEASEFQMAVDKKQRNCHYVGSYCAKNSKVGCIERRESYCCYKSPLARMVAEQIREKAPQVAGDYGPASGPRCGGFTVAQLTAFNWELFDPSEWIALLQDAGMIPQSNSSADSKWGVNSSRAAMAVGAQSHNGEIDIRELTVKRYEPLVDTYSSRREALSRESVCYGDPKLMPWYQPTLTPEDIVKSLGGTGIVSSCGPTCIDIYLGRVGDNYFNDSCSRGYDQYFDVWVDKPEYIESAQLVSAKWDDHIQVTINDHIAYESPGFGNPPARCELGRSWCWGELTEGDGACSGTRPSNDPGMSIDVTELFKVRGRISTNTRVWVGGGGEGFARVKVTWRMPIPGQGDCISPSGVESSQ